MKKIIYIILAVIIVALIGAFVWQNKNVFISTDNFGDNSIITAGNKALNLSGQGIGKIPESVFNQTSLEELNVSNNNLTGAIQSQIGQLKNLKILNASRNQMTGVPAEVGQLKSLEILDLSYNQLTGLPQELGNLQNLKTLNLAGNQVSQQDLNYIRSKLPATTKIITD